MLKKVSYVVFIIVAFGICFIISIVSICHNKTFIACRRVMHPVIRERWLTVQTKVLDFGILCGKTAGNLRLTGSQRLINRCYADNFTIINNGI